MNRVLRRGSVGDDVGLVQGIVGATVDKHFGPATEAKVSAYQLKHGLKADGVVGERTWAVMLAVEVIGTEPPKPVPPVTSIVRPPKRFQTLSQVFANLEEGTAAFNQECYLHLEPDPGFADDIQRAADKVWASPMWSQYVQLQTLRGVPSWATAMIHRMECSNNPKGVLHNGEAIVGTSRKTKLVPAGRGPFKTWMDAALDAVDSSPMFRIPVWNVGNVLRLTERFNGWGYVTGAGKKQRSPYNWAQTTIALDFGKYTSDGSYSATADANGQTGAAAILRAWEDSGRVKVLYSA